MGNTASSLHLIAVSTGLAELSKRTVRAYQQLGYVAAKGDAAADDKTVLVVPGAGGRSFSIYDSDNSAIDNGELKDLAIILSKALKAAAVFTSIYDSDRFEMLFYAKGKLVDAVAGDDSELPADLPRFPLSTRHKKWTSLSGIAVDARALASLLEAHNPQADDTLAKLAALIGVDPVAPLTIVSDLEVDGDTGAALRFRRDPDAPRVAAGAAALQYLYLDDDFPYHRVAPASWPMLAGTRGCEWGLLSLAAGFDRATIHARLDGDPSFGIASASIGAFKFYNGQIVGSAGSRPPEAGPLTVSAVPGVDGHYRIELDGLGVPTRERASTTGILVLVALSLTAERGSATLSVVFEADGAAPVELPAATFTAIEPAWIPVVSGASAAYDEDSSGRSPTHLAEAERVTARARASSLALNHRAVRSSVAVYAGDAGLQPMKEMLESWLEPLVDADGTFTLLTEKKMTASAYVGKSRLDASTKDMLASKAWSKLFSADANLQTIRAGFTPRGGTHPVCGFGMQASLEVSWASSDLIPRTLESMRGRAPGSLSSGSLPTGSTVHAFRWCLDHPSCMELVEGRDAAGSDWNDDLATRVDLFQAWTASWCWIPLFDRGDGYELTPYEAASTLNWFRGILPGDNGLHQVKMEAAWCAAVLRAMTADLWIGPDLMRNVDIDALRVVASVEGCGRATKVRLRDGATLDQLETALISILPFESARLRKRGE